MFNKGHLFGTSYLRHGGAYEALTHSLSRHYYTYRAVTDGVPNRFRGKVHLFLGLSSMHSSFSTCNLGLLVIPRTRSRLVYSCAGKVQ